MRFEGLTGRGRSGICPRCQGAGVVCELDDDLRNAGIVTWGTTAEDFRSSPTTSPARWS